jgi:release factor glutamine methyltransferase
MDVADAAWDLALVARLRAAGCVFAEDEAVALISASRTPSDLEAMVARRAAGEPLEVIVGYADFAGLRIPVESGVFVPRRRTELVASVAARLAPPGSPTSPSIVVDLCCGAGAIAAAIASARPDLTVIAADIDPAAAALAALTLARYGATAIESDIDEGLPGDLRGRVAVIASCPPYVPTAELALMPREARHHEPLVALDGGPDGTAIQARVFAAGQRLLAPGGACVVETSEHLADATLGAAVAAGFVAALETDDERGAVVVVARR